MSRQRTMTAAMNMHYAGRLAKSLSLVTVMTVVALTVGTSGYHYLGREAWIDAFLNASMILSGMGPIGDLPTASGKLFASFYALFSGLFFIATSAILMTPVMRHMLHRFHLETIGDIK